MTRLLIIDDDKSYHEFAESIAERFGVEIVKSTDSWDKARELLITYKPTDIIVDIFMNGGNGIDFVRENQSYDGSFYLMTVDFEREGAASNLNTGSLMFRGTIPKIDLINGIKIIRSIVGCESKLNT